MRTIKLTQGKVAFIDDQDYPLIIDHKWYAHRIHNIWYAKTHVRKSTGEPTKLSMHQLILNVLPGFEIDHINHDGLDNRKHNLRIVTCQQNQFNQKRHRRNSSRFKGVSWHSRWRRWQARVQFNHKRYHLGYFDNEQDAARAYNKAASRLFGKFACLNKIEERNLFKSRE